MKFCTFFAYKIAAGLLTTFQKTCYIITIFVWGPCKYYELLVTTYAMGVWLLFSDENLLAAHALLENVTHLVIIAIYSVELRV